MNDGALDYSATDSSENALDIVPDVKPASDPERPMESDFDGDVRAKYTVKDPVGQLVSGILTKKNQASCTLLFRGYESIFSVTGQQSKERVKRIYNQYEQERQRQKQEVAPTNGAERQQEDVPTNETAERQQEDDPTNKTGQEPQKIVLNVRCKHYRPPICCPFRCIYEEHFYQANASFLVRSATEEKHHTCKTREEKIIAGGELVVTKDITDEMAEYCKQRAITCGGRQTAESLAHEVENYFKEKYKESKF